MSQPYAKNNVEIKHVMGDFLVGAGFASPCSEIADNTQSNIIPISVIVPN